MLDLFGITFTSLAVLLIAFQALRRDRAEPWFQTMKRKADPKAAKQTPWRRGR